MAPPQDERKFGARHAVLQHFQRVQEFVSEEILALADIGLRRQHADGVERQLVAAVIGLARPDRQHDIAGHAELFLDARQRVVVLRGEFFALAASRSKVGSRRYCAGVCTNSGCCGCCSGRPGMARSGSERSGSSPRVAASKVARATPSCCACGHIDCSHCWNAASACAETISSNRHAAALAARRIMPRR